MPICEFKLSSPLWVRVSKNKAFILNLNIYRNAHYQTLNKAKIEYKKLIKKQIEALPTLLNAKIHYKVFPKDKRQFDVSNVASIHQKFFEDALVELEKLPDDSIKFIQESSQSFGEICRDDPRVEITITAKIQENTMQIILDSTEIEQAIVGHIREQGIDLSNATVKVGMTAGRGPNGPTATVDIIPKNKSESTGVVQTFASVSNLATPKNTNTDDDHEDDQEDATLDQVMAAEDDEPEVEEGEELEEAQAANSIFK